jgi:hypothetical protein
MELPYDPVMLILSTYPKEGKSGHNRETCTLKFITSLFTIANLWEQSRCPTTDGIVTLNPLLYNKYNLIKIIIK